MSDHAFFSSFLATAFGAFSLLACLPAGAQVLGNCSGTTADGNSVRFTVATDAVTGAPQLTRALI